MKEENAIKLQIGDKLFNVTDDAPGGKATIGSVEIIDNEQGVISITLSNSHSLSVDGVEQIRLTASILEKNGFKFVGDQYVGAAPEFIRPTFSIFMASATLAKFRYVDEFQRYLRVMGKDELANNFVI